VYYTTGHQERPLFHQAMPSLAMTERFLKENENVELRPLDLGTAPAIPDDASCLLLAGPMAPFSDAQIAILHDYLTGGGRMFLALEPFGESRLEKLMEDWGISTRRSIVIDPESYAHPNPARLLIQQFRPHPVHEGMGGVPLEFPQTQIVRPSEKAPEGAVVTPLLATGEHAWGDEDALKKGFTGSYRPDGREEGGVLCVAAAVEAASKKPRDPKSTQTRLVVWGSAVALTTSNTGHAMQPNMPVLGYILNTFRWLLGAEEAIAKPRESTLRPLTLKPGDHQKIQLVSMVGVPLLGVIFGVLAWRARRK
jgi:hypothetical protein